MNRNQYIKRMDRAQLVRDYVKLRTALKGARVRLEAISEAFVVGKKKTGDRRFDKWGGAALSAVLYLLNAEASMEGIIQSLGKKERRGGQWAVMYTDKMFTSAIEELDNLPRGVIAMDSEYAQYEEHYKQALQLDRQSQKIKRQLIIMSRLNGTYGIEYEKLMREKGKRKE